MRYRGVRPDDGELRERLKALAQERRRFGYRRLHVLLRREGHAVNRKRVQRLYREERLTVRRRGGRKRAIGTRRPMVTPLAADQRWSLDFVSDQLTDGRRFRILAVVDDCTRECLALVADTSISGRRVSRELDNIIRRRSRRPDLRDELLNETLFTSLPHARAVLEAWRRDYNEQRPHSEARLDDAWGLRQRPQRRERPERWRFAGAPRPGLLPPIKQINPGLLVTHA